MSAKKKSKKVEKAIENIDIVDAVEIQPENPPEEVTDPQAPDERTEEMPNVDVVQNPYLQVKLELKKYYAEESKIDAYLNSGIPYDKIRQGRKGGPFLNFAGEIYIPLSLIKS